MDDRSEAVKKVYYRWMSHEDCSMPQFVTFKKDFFWDVDEFTLPINPADIIELLTGEKLGTNILALFSRRARKEKRQQKQPLSSQMLRRKRPTSERAHEDCAMPQFVTFKKDMFWDVDEFTLPINPTDIFELLTGKKLGTNILALFSRGHVLFIICPNHRRGFILDSFKWEKKKTKEECYLVKQVERVVGRLSWELPIVNLQENTWECIFYVMKWVLYFVLKYQHDDFPNIVHMLYIIALNLCGHCMAQGIRGFVSHASLMTRLYCFATASISHVGELRSALTASHAGVKDNEP
ncbi:ulp1 protease family, C-terminal catalytic domain-containing protein, partial [Tanacetum coccineum]